MAEVTLNILFIWTLDTRWPGEPGGPVRPGRPGNPGIPSVPGGPCQIKTAISQETVNDTIKTLVFIMYFQLGFGSHNIC